MLKNTIALLREVKSKINKSEIRIIEDLDEAIKQLEEVPDNYNRKDIAMLLLVILHDVLQHLPSIVAIISSLHSP